MLVPHFNIVYSAVFALQIVLTHQVGPFALEFITLPRQPAGFRPLNAIENAQVQSLCGKTKFSDSILRFKVADGLTASRGQFPWAVAVEDDKGGMSCTGSLISQRHVITAAHCAYKYEKHTLPCKPERPVNLIGRRVGYGGICLRMGRECPRGSDMKVRIRIRQIAALRAFNDNNCMKGNDLAIIELEEDVVFDKDVRPICLGEVDVNQLFNFVDIGFGRQANDKSDILRYMRSELVEPVNDDNQITTAGLYQTEDAENIASLCAGDSGGPLQATPKGSDRTYLIGAHSLAGGCGGDNPGASTSTFVPYYVHFLCQLTGVCR